MDKNNSFKFNMKAGNFKVLEAFLRPSIEGVSISHEPKNNNTPPPIMAYDSAEEILNFIVTVSWEIDKTLFLAWIFNIIEKSNTKKTTINGKQVPLEYEELALFFKSLIEEQQNQTNTNNNRVE